MKLSLGLSPRDYSVAGGVTYDADAQAYFTANTAITNAADKNAINTFYLGLKSDGIYTKIKAMYLPIWGSAASSKWNLVNPLDTDAAFRLTFSTGWTFSSSGMTPSNANARTYYTPSVNALLDSNHVSYYSRTNSAGTEVEIGCSTGGNPPQTFLEIRTASTTYGAVNQTGFVSGSDANSLGFYIASRTASNVIKVNKNGSVIASAGTTASTSRPAIEIRIGGLFNGTTLPFPTTKQCSFSSLGDGLTDTECTNFRSRVNTLMTYFGINV